MAYDLCFIDINLSIILGKIERKKEYSIFEFIYFFTIIIITKSNIIFRSVGKVSLKIFFYYYLYLSIVNSSLKSKNYKTYLSLYI